MGFILLYSKLDDDTEKILFTDFILHAISYTVLGLITLMSSNHYISKVYNDKKNFFSISFWKDENVLKSILAMVMVIVSSLLLYNTYNKYENIKEINEQQKEKDKQN